MNNVHNLQFNVKDLGPTLMHQVVPKNQSTQSFGNEVGGKKLHWRYNVVETQTRNPTCKGRNIELECSAKQYFALRLTLTSN